MIFHWYGWREPNVVSGPHNLGLLTCLLCCEQCRWVFLCHQHHAGLWRSPCSWWWLRAVHSRWQLPYRLTWPCWQGRWSHCWWHYCCCCYCSQVTDGSNLSWHIYLGQKTLVKSYSLHILSYCTYNSHFMILVNNRKNIYSGNLTEILLKNHVLGWVFVFPRIVNISMQRNCFRQAFKLSLVMNEWYVLHNYFNNKLNSSKPQWNESKIYLLLFDKANVSPS